MLLRALLDSLNESMNIQSIWPLLDLMPYVCVVEMYLDVVVSVPAIGDVASSTDRHYVTLVEWWGAAIM